MESNDSPEIPDRGETSDIPGLPSGGEEVGRGQIRGDEMRGGDSVSKSVSELTILD